MDPPAFAFLSAHVAQFKGADIAWVLFSAALVLLMTPGVAFFYGGLVRQKNALSILLQCFLTICGVTLVWILLGYSLAFGPTMLGGFVGNLHYALLLGMEHSFSGTQDPAWVTRSPLFMVFMMMFAIIAPAIIVGGIAERMRMIAYTLFAPIWLLVVFCPVAKWIWGNDPGQDGFFSLGNQGALDFAGGTVVHLNAGIAALVAAIMVGRRTEFGKGGSQPHNVPICVLGGALLWFGWFGFNAGSAGAPDRIAVLAFVNTQVAAAAGGLTWLILDWIRHRRPTAVGLVTGAIAGLVAITPSCGYVSTAWAAPIGAVATLGGFFAVSSIKRFFAYDDSLDAFGIHGVAGFWGAIATGLFASVAVNPDGRDGVFYGNPMQLWLQIKPTLYVIVWSGVGTWAILFVLDRLVGLRAPIEQEQAGLDLSEQAQEAYHQEQ